MDNQYFENFSTFSLFDKKELEYQKYIQEINAVVEKYNILENENQLIGSTDKTFLYLIKFVLNKKEIPKEIETLFLENIFLKEQINSFLEKQLINLLKNESADFYKEISDMLFILSIGIKEKILNSYANFNYDSISILFRYYENLLQKLHTKNKELFSLTFDSYILLLKIFIQLCTIHSMDTLKIKNISLLIELMTESINILKFNIKFDENNIKEMNSIQGKYLYYFSHLENIDIDINNLDTSIKKYFLCLEKQRDGYTLSKDSNFGEKNEHTNSDEFLIYKNYSSIVILKLLNKLKDLNQNIYVNSEYFQAILRFYYKNFSNEFNIKNNLFNIKSFEKELLNNLIYNYTNNLNYIKTIDCSSVIDNFIFSQKSLYGENLQTIYKILLFSTDIKELKYYSIAQILTEAHPIQNQYHEFYKLSILDLVIIKALKTNNISQKENVLKEIFQYIINNEIHYELLSIYSKIHLKLALFYSENFKYLENAKLLYASFMQQNHIAIYKTEYSDIIEKIIKNLKNLDSNINFENIIKDFLISKNLKLNENKNNTSSNNSYEIHSNFMLDDDEYEINY
jgi:hypothetical protein